MGIFDNRKRKPEEKETNKTWEPLKDVKAEKDVKTEKDVKKIAKKEPPLSIMDPSLEFEMMYGLDDSNSVVKQQAADTKSVAKPKADAESKDGKPFFPKTLYKRLVNKKLTIILVENTTEVAKEKEMVLQIINSFVKSDLVCIINYSDTVQQSEIIDISTLAKQNVVYGEKMGDKACLFDALGVLNQLVQSKYLITEEKEKEKVRIDHIEIIGIGTCTDNGSKASKEDALNNFFLATSKVEVLTKYFCLTEDYFLNAAEIGFHSIGSMNRTYQ